MPSNATLLFIYGTLKRGDVRTSLLDGQAYLGQVKTAPHYRLYSVGDYPALVEAAPLNLPGRSIHGELWQIDATCLTRLDEEEGVDEGLYERCAVELIGSPARATTYLYRQPIAGLVDCGDRWLAGLSRR